MGSQEFRPFLVSIAEEIKYDDLDTLKFLCKEKIPNGKLSTINKPITLFDDLIERGHVSKHDTSFLEEILKSAKLEKLSKKVKEYSAQDVNHNAEVRPSKHGLPNKNNHFVGRDAVVHSMVSLLTVEKERMVVILGPPGRGKSTVVSHIGHDLYEKQISVIFVSLRQITTMDLLCTCILKTIDSGCSKSDDVVEQAQNLLTSCRTPTVLILDNCEDIQKSPSCCDFQNFIEYVGSQANNLQLLLGTRKRLSSISFESYTKQLHRLEDSDSTKLLEALAPGKFQGDEAKTLGGRCRGIPLLIKLAASRVNNGYKPSKLAEDLRSRPYEVFKHKGDDIQDYLLNSIRVFLDSLNRELLLSLVRLSNFPNDFTEEQIGEVYKGDWSDTLCSLRANGLVHLEHEHYSLHPLLQTFCREEQERMGCAEEGMQARRAFTLHYLNKLESIHRTFVSKEFQLALKDFEQERMNIQQALENSIKFQCKDIAQKCINTFNNSVNSLGKIMPPSQCLEIYHDVYDMATSQKDTRQIAECLTSIGFVHLYDGNHQTFSKEAMDSFESAYKLFKELKKNKRKTEAFAHCQSKLGLCYIAKDIEGNQQKEDQPKGDRPKRDHQKGFQQMGDRRKGKKLMQDAIDLRKELGDQVYLAASHCDRAIAARLIGEHSQAITILKEECYPIYKDNLGDHPWVATVLNYISDSYKVLGKLEDAKEYTKKSLDIRKRSLGEHQDTARSYVHLAELLRLQGQDHLSDALENYQKALSMQEKVLGVHKETKTSCQAMTEVLKELEPEKVPEMKKRAESFNDAIEKRANVQRQISCQENEKANSHLEKEKLKWKMAFLVVVLAILIGFIISLLNIN